MPSAKWGRASTSLAAAILRPTSRRPSGAPRSPTTTPTNSGTAKAASNRPSAPTSSGSSGWRTTKRRPSTPVSMKHCRTSSRRKRLPCPTPLPEDKGFQGLHRGILGCPFCFWSWDCHGIVQLTVFAEAALDHYLVSRLQPRGAGITAKAALDHRDRLGGLGCLPDLS